MNPIKRVVQSLLTPGIYRAFLAPYHYAWAAFSALFYGFPARKLTVIGITGTKGKSSVAEMLFSILIASGHSSALASTIRFAVNDVSEPNRFKMTVPGHGFLQRFLAQAVRAGCTHAVVELTSEAALQYRHSFLSLDALVFTNLQKEHLESHGGMEKYFLAKYRLARALLASRKRPRTIIANADDSYGKRFLAILVERSLPFSYSDAKETVLRDDGVSFALDGVRLTLPQPGRFSVMNALAAIRAAEALGIAPAVCAEALRRLSRIPGRAERIERGQGFLAIVDYAHTSDSLRALYDAFPDRRKICVLGNMGGGRDAWKRPEMGGIADEYCAEVILTDEDPCDEDPRAIVEAMARGMKRAPRIIMDRREAIRTALLLARPNDAVLVSGKGTDPYILRAKGKREPWSDAAVVAEELERILQ